MLKGLKGIFGASLVPLGDVDLPGARLVDKNAVEPCVSVTRGTLILVWLR